MSSVSDWEFVEVGELDRRLRYEEMRCENRGHLVGVGWRINVDGQHRLQGWCFTCNNSGVGIKKDRPKSEWPDDFNAVPIVQDNRPACRADSFDDHHDLLVLPSRAHGRWYRLCMDCATAVRTDEVYEAPVYDSPFDAVFGEREYTLEDFLATPEGLWFLHKRMCKHCGATENLHEHHYAPRSKFTDAHAWGTVTLCQPCHTLLHSKWPL